jgi:hypothetical protein
MTDDAPPRVAGTTLRGFLSELLFPALLDGRVEPLVSRLGSRSTVDDPLFGRASGLPRLQTLLGQMREWLVARQAHYAPTGLVIGTDRDVAEGTLTLQEEGAPELVLPVAIVAERRRSREVQLRVHHAGEPARSASRDVADTPQAGPTGEPPRPPGLVLDHLEALRRGDVDGVLACFESDGFVRDALGREHPRSDSRLKDYWARRFGLGEEGAGADVRALGYADDGRACAIELGLADRKGQSQRPVLAVYERGTSALFHALRLYEQSSPEAGGPPDLLGDTLKPPGHVGGAA